MDHDARWIRITGNAGVISAVTQFSLCHQKLARCTALCFLRLQGNTTPATDVQSSRGYFFFFSLNSYLLSDFHDYYYLPGAVKIHHIPTVMPGNTALRRCTLHINNAREAYRATLLDIHVFRSLNFRLSNCNINNPSDLLQIISPPNRLLDILSRDQANNSTIQQQS